MNPSRVNDKISLISVRVCRDGVCVCVCVCVSE